MVHEVVVYVHGVTPRGQTSHAEQYQSLHQALRALNPAIPQTYCGVEWGWDPTGGQGRSHQLLDKAEEQLGRRAMDAVQDHNDFTLNPLRIAVDKFRGLMIFGLADVFYYVSQDGKNAVRYAVAESVLAHLRQLNVDLDADAVSLTLLGHSAGSVAAFDFLFALFYAPRTVEEFVAPAKIQAGASGVVGPAAAAVATTVPNVAATLSDLRRLKTMAQNGRLRARRLFTFGSPVTALAFRADSLLAILARDEDPTRANRVDGAHYGLTRNDAVFGPPLPGARWVNFWDKDDPIAWPVEPLVKQAGAEVADVYVDVSDSVTAAHSAYWESAEFQREVAGRW